MLQRRGTLNWNRSVRSAAAWVVVVFRQVRNRWDGPAPNVHEASSGPGRSHTDLWAWDRVPAPLTDDRGAALRNELDLLVLRLIVPQRARSLAQLTS